VCIRSLLSPRCVTSDIGGTYYVLSLFPNALKNESDVFPFPFFQGGSTVLFFSFFLDKSVVSECSDAPFFPESPVYREIVSLPFNQRARRPFSYSRIKKRETLLHPSPFISPSLFGCISSFPPSSLLEREFLELFLNANPFTSLWRVELL